MNEWLEKFWNARWLHQLHFQWTVIIIQHHTLEEIKNKPLEGDQLKTGLNELRKPNQYFLPSCVKIQAKKEQPGNYEHSVNLISVNCPSEFGKIVHVFRLLWVFTGLGLKSLAIHIALHYPPSISAWPLRGDRMSWTMTEIPPTLSAFLDHERSYFISWINSRKECELLPVWSLIRV